MDWRHKESKNVFGSAREIANCDRECQNEPECVKIPQEVPEKIRMNRESRRSRR